MAKARLTKVSAVAAILAESATPDSYRRNPFRILELPVDCGELQLNKRVKLINIAEKTGQPIPPGEGRALPIPTSGDGQGFEQAARRLLNPEERLVDEFFWFWPHRLGESHEDDALAALRDDDLERAVDLWVDQANARSEDSASLHNLAILSHALALDLELKARDQRLSADGTKEAAIYWRQAFSRWNRLFLSEGSFWERLKRRVRDFGDPRVSDATVDEIRSSLPKTVLLINARLAIEASERGDSDGVRRQLALMDASGFDGGCKAGALAASVAPLRQRITAICTVANQSGEADPVKGDVVAAQLLANCRPLLESIDAVLGPDLATRVAAHDEVAVQGLETIRAFARKTEKWRAAAQVVQDLAAIAASPSTKARMAEVAGQLLMDADSGNDWCGEGYYDLPADLLAGLEAARGRLSAGDPGGAIRMLEAVLSEQVMQAGSPQHGLVLKPLATCLDMRAVDSFRSASDILGSPWTLNLNIKRQKSVNFARYERTRVLMKYPSGLAQARATLADCMACGDQRALVSDWMTYTAESEEVLVCPACIRKHEEEKKARRTQVEGGIVSAGKDFLRAQALDPTNPRPGKNLTALRRVARDLSIVLPVKPDYILHPQAGEVKVSRPAAPSRPENVPQPPTRPQARARQKATATTGASHAKSLAHLVAWALDGFVIVMLFLPLSPSTFNQPATLFLFPAAYFAGCHLLFKRTLGEAVARVRVRNADGSARSVSAILWRACLLAGLFLLSAYSPLGLLPLLVPLANRDRRGLQDYLAGSQMVET